VDGGGGGGGRVRYAVTSNRATGKTWADAPSFSVLCVCPPPMWVVFPPLWKAREQRAQLLHHFLGGTGARRRRRRQRTEKQQKSQSLNNFAVQGSCGAANQQMRNCKQVSLRQSACTAARPRPFGPQLQSRRFPSFPVVSRRFSPFLVRSSSNPRRTPALRRLSRAKQARSRKKGVRVEHHDMSAVHFVRPSDIFKARSDQIAGGRGVRAPTP